MCSSVQDEATLALAQRPSLNSPFVIPSNARDLGFSLRQRHFRH